MNLRPIVQAARLVSFAGRFGPIGWIIFAILVGLVTAGIVKADVTTYTWNGTLTNPQPNPQMKRVSKFEAVVVEGETIYYLAEGIQGPTTATSVGHSGGGTMRIAAQPYSPANTPVGDLIEFGVVTYINSGAPFYSGYNFTWPYTVMPSGATKLQLRWKRESPFFQAAYNNATTIIAASSGTTEDELSYGPLIEHWSFQMPPHSNQAITLSHTGPFFVKIENLVEKPTPDGGVGYEWETDEDHTSTENTYDAPEDVPEGDGDNEVDAPEVEYSSGDIAAPAVRPETVDSFETLDQADEARHQDTAGILAQIKAGIDTAVGTIAGLSKGTPTEAEQMEADLAEADSAWDEAMDGAEAFMASADAVASAAGNLATASGIGLPTGAPSLFLSLPIPWSPGNNLTLTSNDTMDYWMLIARTIMIAGMSFTTICAAISMGRNAFAG